MKIEVRKEGDSFVVDPVELPGMPTVGRGRTLYEALGSFLIGYQKELGIEIVVHATAGPAERARRARELGRR